MPNKILYDSTPTMAALILGAAVTPTAKALANDGKKLGDEFNNATGLNQYGVAELYVRGASAFTAGGYVELYLIPSADGTNYSDGSDSVAPPASTLAGVFPVLAVTTQQRLTLWGLVLPPLKFKFLIINKTGQAFTNTDDENILKFGAYNDEVQ